MSKPVPDKIEGGEAGYIIGVTVANAIMGTHSGAELPAEKLRLEHEERERVQRELERAETERVKKEQADRETIEGGGSCRADDPGL